MIGELPLTPGHGVDADLREGAERIAAVEPLVVADEQLVRRAVGEVGEELEDGRDLDVAEVVEVVRLTTGVTRAGFC